MLYGIIVSYRRSPRLSAGDFGQRVHHVRGRRLKRGDAQAVDQPVALETAARVPQYVAERIFQYKLMAQPFDVLPVNRVRRARRAVIDLHAWRPVGIEYTTKKQKKLLLLFEYTRGWRGEIPTNSICRFFIIFTVVKIGEQETVYYCRPPI